METSPIQWTWELSNTFKFVQYYKKKRDNTWTFEKTEWFDTG